MIDLSKISTLPPEDTDKKLIKEKSKKLKLDLEMIQMDMIKSPTYSVLVILQGMDASGKDGIIRDGFSGLIPTTLSVSSFKKPTDLEMSHDFLWRVHQVVPQKGHIKIFNRSHYEDVLIQKVHHWVDDKVIEQRYQQINDFERLLTENNTKILKCYLHVSREKQMERLKERETKPEEHYKYNENDIKEAALWDDYMSAYHMAFKKCNEVPWEVIPADKNWYKSYLVLHKIKNLLKN